MANDALKSRFHPRRLAAALASLLVVLALTHIPLDALPKSLQSNPFDKIEHTIAYGLVAVLFILSLKKPVASATLLLGLAGLLAVAALDEITQPLVNRVASLADYCADLMGIGAACLLCLGGGWLKRRSARS